MAGLTLSFICFRETFLLYIRLSQIDFTRKNSNSIFDYKHKVYISITSISKKVGNKNIKYLIILVINCLEIWRHCSLFIMCDHVNPFHSDSEWLFCDPSWLRMIVLWLFESLKVWFQLLTSEREFYVNIKDWYLQESWNRHVKNVLKWLIYAFKTIIWGPFLAL